jgi:hypothetical protein
MDKRESECQMGINCVSQQQRSFILNQEFQLSLVDILSEIDAEISRLEQAKQLLSDTPVKRGPGRPPTKGLAVAPNKERLPMSAAARRKIAAAQKARWAKAKKAK